MAVNTLYQNQVQTMYIAYFGRPADPMGLDYYTNLMASQGGSYAALLDDFFNSAESTAEYGALTLAAKVNAFYQNLFQHDADAAGLAYWVNMIQTGQVNLGQAAYTIAYNAQTDDADILAAKQGAAATWTAHVDQTAEILAYETNTDAGRDFLDQVDTAGEVISDADVDAAILAMTGNPGGGTTYTLTTGLDNVVGTSGNDTILGYVAATDSTLQSFDIIDGGAGIDRLLVSFEDTESVTVVSQGVENLALRALEDNDTITVDLGLASGIDTVFLEDAPAYDVYARINNVTSILDINASNVAQNGSASMDFSFTNSVGTGTNDTLTITLEDAGHITDGVNAYSFSIDSYSTSAGASFIENVDIVASGSSNSLYLDNGFDAVQTVTITGAADLNLSSSDDFSVLTRLDASLATGDLLIDSLSTTLTSGTVDVTLGSGNDFLFLENSPLGTLMTVDMGAGNDYLYQSSSTDVTVDMGEGNDFLLAYSSSTTTTRTYDLGAGNDVFYDLGYMETDTDAVNGGTGTDTVFIDSGANLTADYGDMLTSFEQLGVQSGIYDLAHLGGINRVLTWVNDASYGPSWLADDGSDYGVSGWNADVTVDNATSGLTTVQVGGNGDANSLAVNLATDGASDAITVILSGTSDVTVGAGTADGLLLADYESITINSTNSDIDTTANVNTIVNLGAASMTELTITGGNKLTFTNMGTAGATDTSALARIDASAFTGALTFSEASGTLNGVDYIGGSGKDTYTGTANGDAINAGAGADAITLDATFASIDTLVFEAGDSKLNATADGHDVYTSFGTAASAGALDVIDLGALSFTGTQASSLTNKGAVANALVDGTTLNSADFFSSGGFDRGAAIGTNGGNTYVWVDVNKDGDFSAANDLFIQLSGVTDVTLANFGF